MAIKFNQIKSTSLHLGDKLAFGKFRGCRIIDVLETDWEYLKWLHSNKNVNFSKQVIDSITEKWSENESRIFFEEEVKPWLSDTLEDVPY